LELIELTAKPRETTGKGAARELRKNNAIPAIVYGPKTDPMMLSLETVGFDKIIKKHGSMGVFFNLKVEDNSGQDKIVMLKQVQMDTFGLRYLHVDFHEIDMETKITITVPVETIGVCPGVAEGGLLQVIRRDLDVICKPVDAPETIQIDISNLEVGHAVHIEDIDLGENVEIPHEVNYTIVTIVAPSIEEEEVDEEEEDLEEDGVQVVPDGDTPAEA